MWNKNSITWQLLLGLLILGAISLLLMSISSSRLSAKSSVSSNGHLETDINNHNFGDIKMGDGLVTHDFTLTNNSSEAVTIYEVYTSCMCTTAKLSDSFGNFYGRFGMPGHGGSSKTNIKLEPNQSIAVTAIFDPAAHGPNGVGLANRTIYLETNSITKPRVQLNFSALVSL